MIQKYGLYVTWILACLGVLGSLYFSEILHFEPCQLCWFQRIFLYPIAILLGMATYKGDRQAIPYLLPLAFLGLITALFQITLQEIPSFNPTSVCGSGPSCSTKTDVGLGFLSIPMLSALNFSTIAALLFIVKSSSCTK